MAGTRLMFGVVFASLAMTACGGFGSLPFRGGRTPAPVTAVVPAVSPTPAAAVVAEPVFEVAPPVEPAAVAIEAADDIALPAVESAPVPPAWDIEVAPYETNARVAYFVSRFSGPMRPTFEVALARQTRYAPMIHAKLRSAGLPEDMIYLPLIESWYDPHAYSRAAAVGMWQFMTTTAKGVGLRVDWWMDERRDPVRATDGAVAHLVELRDSFGSMYLAAAAYNGGSGRVSRGLAKHASQLEGVEGEDLFFALADEKALRAETADYVPKLIAAALVGKEPARYGVTIAQVEPFAWDSVLVPAATPLAAVAKALDVPLDTVMDYNPHVLRGMTPPVGASVYLRVPLGTAADFPARFAELPEAERSAVKRVVTKSGDYMTKIAKANGLTAKQINAYNPQATRLKNGNLTAGQRILVPRVDVVRAARDVPDPKIERYGTSASGRHVVKKGESLSVIAKRNGTSVAAIKRMNGLKSDRIRVGQKLRVR
ncbi:MAG: LysM peptidoglycan-binding domain-containing protein [Gemmatimonadaceae bacterium]